MFSLNDDYIATIIIMYTSVWTMPLMGIHCAQVFPIIEIVTSVRLGIHRVAKPTLIMLFQSRSTNSFLREPHYIIEINDPNFVCWIKLTGKKLK